MSRRIACIRVPGWPTGAPGSGADRGALLAAALLAAVPRVAPVAGRPGVFWGDASGMERLGGDPATAAALVAAAREAGPGGERARVGIADSCMAAAAAARERGGAWRVVPPGGDAAYLRRRPLTLLPVPAATRASLQALGLATCGELADLSPADVELRLGAEGLLAWRLSRGDDPRRPFRPLDPEMARAEAELEPPVHGTEPLRFLLGGLVSAVLARLDARQRIPAALRLTLRVEGVRTTEEERIVRPARPTADARVLAEMCRRALEERPPAGPVAALALEAAAEGTARADQLDAFRPPAPDPGALHAALLPVFARWGPEALCRAERRGAHLPAEHAAWVPLGAEGIAAFAAAGEGSSGAGSDPDEGGDAEEGDGNGMAGPPPRPGLELCLRRPDVAIPLRVRTGGGGAPLHLCVEGRGAMGADRLDRGFPPSVWKTRAEGPERVSGAWWDHASAREYWRVESPEGWMGLVYRDAATGRWHLEGWYD